MTYGSPRAGCGPEVDREAFEQRLPEGARISCMPTRSRIWVVWRDFERVRRAVCPHGDADGHDGWLTPYEGRPPVRAALPAAAATLETRGLRARVTSTGSATRPIPVLQIESHGESTEAFIARVTAAVDGAAAEAAWLGDSAPGLIPNLVVRVDGELRCLGVEIDHNGPPTLGSGIIWLPDRSIGFMSASVLDAEPLFDWIASETR